jgi:hypothetical protein
VNPLSLYAAVEPVSEWETVFPAGTVTVATVVPRCEMTTRWLTVVGLVRCTTGDAAVAPLRAATENSARSRSSEPAPTHAKSARPSVPTVETRAAATSGAGAETVTE